MKPWKGIVMKGMEYQLPEGKLEYVEREQEIEVTGYHGLAGAVSVPQELPLFDDAAHSENAMGKVTSIAKKAFLSKKYLRSVTIPASVENVGDWAFAYCNALREVSFEGRDVQFGKDVFKECAALRCVRFAAEDFKPGSLAIQGQAEGIGARTEQELREGIGGLTAAAVTQMDAAYLLDAKEAGSKEWLGKWDARMLTILHAADDEGYSKQILCGEEDYESADLETYLINSRKKKVRLLLLRLYWPMGLDSAVRDQLKEYLLTHSKGCKTDETWQVIRDECGDRREFYELFARLGCLSRENAPLVIAETREDCPEMKAFFLKYQADHFAQVDYFADMEL